MTIVDTHTSVWEVLAGRAPGVPVGRCSAVLMRWRVSHFDFPTRRNVRLRNAGGQLVGTPRQTETRGVFVLLGYRRNAQTAFAGTCLHRLVRSGDDIRIACVARHRAQRQSFGH